MFTLINWIVSGLDYDPPKSRFLAWNQFEFQLGIVRHSKIPLASCLVRRSEISFLSLESVRVSGRYSTTLRNPASQNYLLYSFSWTFPWLAGMTNMPDVSLYLQLPSELPEWWFWCLPPTEEVEKERWNASISLSLLLLLQRIFDNQCVFWISPSHWWGSIEISVKWERKQNSWLCFSYHHLFLSLLSQNEALSDNDITIVTSSFLSSSSWLFWLFAIQIHREQQ